MDIITVSQGDPYIVTQTECCVFIPMRLLIDHLYETTWGHIWMLWMIHPHFRRFNTLVVQIMGLLKKAVIDLGNHWDWFWGMCVLWHETVLLMWHLLLVQQSTTRGPPPCSWDSCWQLNVENWVCCIWNCEWVADLWSVRGGHPEDMDAVWPVSWTG